MATEPHNMILEQLRELRRAQRQMLDFITDLRGQDLKNALHAIEIQGSVGMLDHRLKRLERHLGLRDD